jgi:hypothetical protein
MCRTDAIEMGDADQYPEVGVQLLLKRGAWESWLLATSGFKPLLDGLVHLGGVPTPAIVQGRLSSCAELLEPVVGSRSTGLHSCNLGSFLPRLACLHEHHHLLFGSLSWFILHNAFPRFILCLLHASSAKFAVSRSLAVSISAFSRTERLRARAAKRFAAA